MEATKRNSGRYGRDPEVSARNQDRIRSIIKVEEIVKKLNNHILGKAKMTNTMVRAAEILLRKIQPDLVATHITTDDGVGVPLLKIVRAVAAPALEHEPVDAVPVVDTGQSHVPLDGAELQTRDVCASSSEVLPD